MTVSDLPTVEARWNGRTYHDSLIRWPSDGDDGAVFLQDAEPADPSPVILIHDDGTEEVIGYNERLASGRPVGLSEVESLVFFPPSHHPADSGAEQ